MIRNVIFDIALGVIVALALLAMLPEVGA